VLFESKQARPRKEEDRRGDADRRQQHATADDDGDYVFGVTSVALCNTRLSANFRYAPFATEFLWRRNTSLPAQKLKCRRRIASLSAVSSTYAGRQQN
jgi:hypothetical protein